jgi:uncharacterized membrane protein
MSGSSEDDRQMDIVIGHILRIGVSVAAAVVFTGWIMYLGGARGAVADYRHFHGQPVSITTGIASILHGVGALDSLSIMEAGVLLLIATPVLRVAFCVAAFAARKDARYVLISGIVLAVLLYSLFFRS